MKRFIEMLLLFAAVVFVSLLIREAILNSDLPDYIKFCTLTDWEKAKWISGDAARYATTRGCMRTLRDANRARREGRNHY